MGENPNHCCWFCAEKQKQTSPQRNPITSMPLSSLAKLKALQAIYKAGDSSLFICGVPPWCVLSKHECICSFHFSLTSTAVPAEWLEELLWADKSGTVWIYCLFWAYRCWCPIDGLWLINLLQAVPGGCV